MYSAVFDRDRRCRQTRAAPAQTQGHWEPVPQQDLHNIQNSVKGGALRNQLVYIRLPHGCSGLVHWQQTGAVQGLVCMVFCFESKQPSRNTCGTVITYHVIYWYVSTRTCIVIIRAVCLSSCFRYAAVPANACASLLCASLLCSRHACFTAAGDCP